MSDNNENDNKETQTRLHVEPHVLNDENERALVICDRACQTAVTSFPDIDDSVFFSLLEFIPYKDIDQNALRILDLPRKHRLQFKLPGDESENATPIASSSSVTSKRSVPFKRALKRKKIPADSDICEEILSQVAETDTQTSLTVLPHVLDENEVAKIVEEVATQVVTGTIIDVGTPTPTNSKESDIHKAVAEILSELLTKIREAYKLDETKCCYYIICSSDEMRLLNEHKFTCYCSETCCANSIERSASNNQEKSYIFCGCDLADLHNIKSALQLLILKTAPTSFYSDKEIQTYQEYLTLTISVQTEESHVSVKSVSTDWTNVCVQGTQTELSCYINIHSNSETKSKTSSTNDSDLSMIKSISAEVITDTQTEANYFIDTFSKNNSKESEKRKPKTPDMSDFESLKDASSGEHEVIRLPMIIKLQYNFTDNSFMPQSEGRSLTEVEESLHATQELTGCTDTYETMSKIPVALNRKNNCPSKLALCQQKPVSQNPCENNGKNGNNSKSESNGGKRLICKIKITTADKYEGTTDKPEETNGKKTVSLNTGNESGDKKVAESTKDAEESVQKCTCKKEEPPQAKKEPFIPLSEIETVYFEHYVEELQSSSTGVQTELDNGSDSVDSLPCLPDGDWCGAGAELPWQKFILSTPGSYTIRSSKKEVSDELTLVYFS